MRTVKLNSLPIDEVVIFKAGAIPGSSGSQGIRVKDDPMASTRNSATPGSSRTAMPL